MQRERLDRLTHACAGLWGAGLCGMFAAKGLFAAGPGTIGFDLFSIAWLAGGLTYAFLGFLFLAEDAQPER